MAMKFNEIVSLRVLIQNPLFTLSKYRKERKRLKEEFITIDTREPPLKKKVRMRTIEAATSGKQVGKS